MHELMEISINHRRMIQTNLMGKEVIINVVWVFIGIFSAKKLGITRNEWWKTITDREVLNEILTWSFHYISVAHFLGREGGHEVIFAGGLPKNVQEGEGYDTRQGV